MSETSTVDIEKVGALAERVLADDVFFGQSVSAVGGQLVMLQPCGVVVGSANPYVDGLADFFAACDPSTIAALVAEVREQRALRDRLAVAVASGTPVLEVLRILTEEFDRA